MNVALLTAAGSGTRMHQDIPKQFMHVDNKPIIIHTMERFQNHPSIDAIIVVTLDSWIDVLWAYARQFNISKLKWVVAGGDTGQESIYKGLCKLSQCCSPEDTVLIHDGNRCNVSQQIISDSLAVFKEHESAIAAIPCVEAVFCSQDGRSANEEVPRERLWRTQTPHTYSLKRLLWAHDEAKKRGISNTTATCSLMQTLGETIWFSRGSEENIKITTVDDLKIYEALLHSGESVGWLK